MLTSLRLVNFKAFKDTSFINLAPLTILTGPNSSGKSAILRSLMALRQTVEDPDSTTSFVPTGRFVDIGPYYDFVYDQDKKSVVQFQTRFTLMPSEFPSSLLQIPDADKKVVLSVDLSLGYVQRSDTIYLRSSQVTLSQIFDINRVVMSGPYPIGRRYKTTVTWQSNTISLPPSPTAKFSVIPAPLLRDFRSPDQQQERNQLVATELARVAGEIIRSQLTRIQYIGPFRVKPERMYLYTGQAPSDVGTSGENGPATLWARSRQSSRFERNVSGWLKKMGLAREVSIESLYASYFVVDLVDPNVIDSKKKLQVNLPDVGFGTSQILPILVQGLIAEPGSTLLLEQPEIHLHPRVQAEMADFLIEQSRRGVGIIVETHSEHIIGRLQRLVAQERLQPNEFEIYNVTPHRNGSLVQKVVIDEYGRFVKPPAGFMDQGFSESFGLMEALSKRLSE